MRENIDTNKAQFWRKGALQWKIFSVFSQKDRRKYIGFGNRK